MQYKLKYDDPAIAKLLKRIPQLNSYYLMERELMDDDESMSIYSFFNHVIEGYISDKLEIKDYSSLRSLFNEIEKLLVANTELYADILYTSIFEAFPNEICGVLLQFLGLKTKELIRSMK